MSDLSVFARQTLLPEVGLAGQSRLSAAHVLVVGAGGLGCPVLQYLAAAGIGQITIMDPDHVERSNLHRQPLYGLMTLAIARQRPQRSALAVDGRCAGHS